jgi:hypothetical protein
MSAIPRILTFCLLMACGMSCSGYQSTGAKLKNVVQRYNEAVRWRKYKAAAHFVRDVERKAYVNSRREAGADTKILDYEIVNVRQVLPNKEAEILVSFTWHQMPSNVVQTIHFKQKWIYGKNRKWWYVEQKEVKKKAAKSHKPMF